MYLVLPGHGIEEPVYASWNKALGKNKYYLCFMNAWIYGYPMIFRQGELALSSIQGRVDSVFERMLGSVILQLILPVYLVPESIVYNSICCLVRTDFGCVMANLSSGLRLLLKK